MRKLIPIIAAVLLLAGCGSSTPKQAAGGSVHPPGWGSTPQGVRVELLRPSTAPSAEMWDTITLQTVPANPFALAGYTSGFWPTYLPLRRSYPNAHTMSIAVTSRFHADCLDVEPGDASPSQAGPWAASDLQAGFAHPCLYGDLANMPAIKASLASSLGPNWHSRVFLWLAWYRFHSGLIQGYDAVQWTDTAYGRNLDESTVSLTFLTAAQPPYVAPHPTPQPTPKPTPKPTPSQKHNELVKSIARREAIRAYLIHYGCRHRVTHHEGVGPNCKARFSEGNRNNAKIAKLRQEGL